MKKQGTADRDVYESSKREPRPRSISLDAVSRIGTIVGPGTPYQTITNRDGTLQAPMSGSQLYPGGSQSPGRSTTNPNAWKGRR